MGGIPKCIAHTLGNCCLTCEYHRVRANAVRKHDTRGSHMAYNMGSMRKRSAPKVGVIISDGASDEITWREREQLLARCVIVPTGEKIADLFVYRIEPEFTWADVDLFR